MSSAASSLLFNQSCAAHHCESMSSPASSPQPVLCGKIFSHLSKTATHHLFGERNRPTTIHLVAQHNHLPTIYLVFLKRATYHTFGGVLFLAYFVPHFEMASFHFFQYGSCCFSTLSLGAKQSKSRQL